MNSPSIFQNKCVGEDIGSLFGNGTRMALIFMLSADENLSGLSIELAFEALSDPRRSAFISVISVPK